MQIDLSVADGASLDRFDAWSAANLNAAGASVQPLKQHSAPLAVRYGLCCNGHSSVAADGHSVLRRPAEITRKSAAGSCIYRERCRLSWWRQGRREFVTRTGDLLLTDPDLPMAQSASPI